MAGNFVSNNSLSDMQGQEGGEQNWMPLESNPEVINEFIGKMGLKTDLFSFQELLSLEEWGLEMIPKPVLGIMMLYEQSPAQNEFKNKEADTLKPQEIPSNVFYMKQHAINACGTIALFHITLNAKEKHPELIKPDSFLDKFSQKAMNKDSEARADIFKNSEEIMHEHIHAVNEGQSNVSSNCNSHFISFVPKNGRIYELDGFKKCPVDHGACTEEEFLAKGAAEIRKFMDRDPDNINFSMIVLCSAQAQ